ncbi:phosphatidylinositol-4-phosphate 5-kinase family protein [Striga asiatica]|uniref:Phosphatidylinositol-4-phosphate 5-kinase family protein n=1 Tax=Striga asiatica TaxID=4170 RepID=A0A5A7QHY2_STRAF|nr:phosphatidylinositol-4-phosphate 5-kinase family protein [Striga asiatica]
MPGICSNRHLLVLSRAYRKFAVAGWILPHSPEVDLTEIRSRRGFLGRADEGSDERTEAAAHHGGPLLLFENGVARLWWIDGKAEIGDWKLGSAAAREFAGEERHNGVRRFSCFRWGAALFQPGRSPLVCGSAEKDRWLKGFSEGGGFAAHSRGDGSKA